MATQNPDNCPQPDQKPVIVCTDKRGVFFGYIPAATDIHDLLGPESKVTLTRARMAVYWSRDVGGIMGLASSGPSKSCRIGPAVTVALVGVHGVVDVEAEAATKWESAPWA